MAVSSKIVVPIIGGDYFDFFGKKPTFYFRPVVFESGMVYNQQ